VLVVATTLSVLDVRGLPVPEAPLSALVGEAIGPTADALRAGEGPAIGEDGTYVVFWQDAAYIGSPGYGVLNELERRGFDVGVHDTWRVPAGAHRVLEPDAIDAEVHVVTGSYVDEWRQRDGYVEVAYVDERTPDQRARYAELEAQVIAELHAIGRDEVIADVRTNLFGAMLAPDLPGGLVATMAEMHSLFGPLAVFIAPAGSTN
jgi:hypothetical protein